MDDTDTIYALSSGMGSQATAVAVVRLSGPQSRNYLTTLLTPRQRLPSPRYAAVRKLYWQDTLLDNALVLYFNAPKSYTGQDCVELQLHGSRAVVAGVLDALSTLGGRLAEPGEFTQRAFASGKLDLLQVEALADLLSADTSAQRSQALAQLDGDLSAIYKEWRSQLIAGLAHAEAVIDFGDDERLDDDVFDNHATNSQELMAMQESNIWGTVVDRMQELRNSMLEQLKDEQRGELVREGVKIAILGAPNAGKSSLFNILANKESAIVSNIAGTTRDVLELNLNLNGIKCILQDTAGVRNHTTDTIEQIGMERALKAASNADLVVVLVDATDPTSGRTILKQVQTETELADQYILTVYNKLDLATETDSDDEASNVSISCLTRQGMEEFLQLLTDRVKDRLGGATRKDPTEGTLLTRARHRQHVQAASEALERFITLSAQGSLVVDMAAEELRLAASELGRITGAVDVEDVLDKLFMDFCIGK